MMAAFSGRGQAARLRPLRRRLDRLAWPLGLLGLIGVAAYNWRLWQQDKEALAAKADPPPLPPPEEWPALPVVTVLVAAWNEAGFIGRHIESFLALRYPRKELVLCAGGADGTYERAMPYAGPQVTVLRQRPGEGKQRALARSLPQARGEVVFLTDADCLLDDDAFERTLYPVTAGEEQVCSGSSRPLAEQMDNPFVVTQAASHLYGSLRAPDYASGLLGRNCAVRRDLLQRSRGFEAPAPTGTDYVLAKELARCGACIRHEAQSRIVTDYPEEPLSYMRQQRRWLRNLFFWGLRYRDWSHVRHAVKASFAGLVGLFMPLSTILLGRTGPVGWLLLLLHTTLARTRYVKLMFDEIPSPLALSRAIFADFTAWSMLWIDLLHPTRRKQW